MLHPRGSLLLLAALLLMLALAGVVQPTAAHSSAEKPNYGRSRAPSAGLFTSRSLRCRSHRTATAKRPSGLTWFLSASVLLSSVI